MDLGLTRRSVNDYFAKTAFGRDLRDEALTEGHTEGAAQTLAALLRRRFGNDPRIPAIAEQLAHSHDPAAAVTLIDESTDLDHLARGSAKP